MTEMLRRLLLRTFALSLMYLSMGTAVTAHQQSCPLFPDIPNGPRGCPGMTGCIESNQCEGDYKCICLHPGSGHGPNEFHCYLGRMVGSCGWTAQEECEVEVGATWYPMTATCCSQGDDQCHCNQQTGMIWDDNLGCISDPCPILINLRNNSANYRLTSPQEGVPFDLTATGQQHWVSWTTADSSVAFLVLDRNGNGAIDDGSELFGTATVKSDGTRAPHGFDAMADVDGNQDGQLDSDDPVYEALRLWLDRNHNGISESTELVRLSDAGLTTVFTAYRDGHRTDQHGNEYRYEGMSLLRKGDEEVRRRVFDVFLEMLR